jgi:RNA recognition motif-containing protein
MIGWSLLNNFYMFDYLIERFRSTHILGESFKNIQVCSLHYSIAEDDLKEAFSEFGELSSVTINNG